MVLKNAANAATLLHVSTHSKGEAMNKARQTQVFGGNAQKVKSQREPVSLYDVDYDVMTIS